MNRLLIALVVSAVLISLGGYLINMYGKAQYNDGYTTAKQENIIVSTELNVANTIELERLQNEVDFMPHNDVIVELYNLGVMRNYADR